MLVNFLNRFGMGLVLGVLNGNGLIFYFFAGLRSAAILRTHFSLHKIVLLFQFLETIICTIETHKINL